ncbi:hypothetical protein PTKIN_Ptkin10aG0114600 [Pterospermum kingtungense]
MTLRYLSLALLFQLLFFMYGPHQTYAVKNLREKQQEAFHDVVEENPSFQLRSEQLSKKLEGIWNAANKNPSSQLPSKQLVKELEKIPFYKMPSQQLVKELEDTYLSLTMAG